MTTRNLTFDDFESTIVDNPIVLVDCGPCRAFTPVFERSSQAHPDIVHAKIDTQAEPELAAIAAVRSIPTIMAFRDGILVYSRPGVMPPTVLEDLIIKITALDMDEVRASITARKAAASA